jgi:hypothetical protein
MKRTGNQKLDLIKYLLVVGSVFLYTLIPSCALLPPQVDSEPDQRSDPPQGAPLPVSQPGSTLPDPVCPRGRGFRKRSKPTRRHRWFWGIGRYQRRLDGGRRQRLER